MLKAPWHCIEGDKRTTRLVCTTPTEASQKTPNYSECLSRTQTHTDLVDSADLTVDTVILHASATRAVVSWHVNTHHMLVYREVLEERNKTHAWPTASLLLCPNSLFFCLSTRPASSRRDPHVTQVLFKVPVSILTAIFELVLFFVKHNEIKPLRVYCTH